MGNSTKNGLLALPLIASPTSPPFFIHALLLQHFPHFFPQFLRGTLEAMTDAKGGP